MNARASEKDYFFGIKYFGKNIDIIWPGFGQIGSFLGEAKSKPTFLRFFLLVSRMF